MRVLGCCLLEGDLSAEDPIESFSLPSFFNLLSKKDPSCRPSSSLVSNKDRGVTEGADSYSVGTILCYDPTSDSDVRQCNFKIWNNLDSNVGDKVWKVISNLGVVARDEKKDYSKKLKWRLRIRL